MNKNANFDKCHTVWLYVVVRICVIQRTSPNGKPKCQININYCQMFNKQFDYVLILIIDIEFIMRKELLFRIKEENSLESIHIDFVFVLGFNSIFSFAVR